MPLTQHYILREAERPFVLGRLARQSPLWGSLNVGCVRFLFYFLITNIFINIKVLKLACNLHNLLLQNKPCPFKKEISILETDPRDLTDGRQA